MNPDQVRELATETARAAMRELLLTLGIDASDPKAILELQRDFAYTRAWRGAIESARSATVASVILVMVTGFLGALWLIFRPGH